MEFTPSFHPRHTQTRPQIHAFPTPNPPIYPLPYHHPPQPSINHHPNTLFLRGGLSEYEQKLTDEVIYLHSLWHRGPPLNPNPNPFLKPSSSTPFKKKKKKNKSKKTLKPHLVSDKEWPVESKPTCPSPPGSAWGPFNPCRAQNNRPVSADEHARVSALKVQLKGLDSCIGLFRESGGGGGDDDDEDDDDDDDDDEDDDYVDDCDEEFEFLLKVFEGDEQLRGYYEKNCEDGEFYCLVCGVIGNKFGRKYKNCVALVQHSVSISRTKKKKAHRAYGYVVCKVLGWDINRLPSLPISNGDGNSKSLEKCCEVQGEAKKHADGCDDNLNAVDVETNFAKVSDSQPEQKEVSNQINKDNASCTDEGCNPNQLVHSEGGRNDNADGSKEDTHYNLKREGVCSSEHGLTQLDNSLVSNPIDCVENDVGKNLEAADKRVKESETNVEAH